MLLEGDDLTTGQRKVQSVSHAKSTRDALGLWMHRITNFVNIHEAAMDHTRDWMASVILLVHSIPLLVTFGGPDFLPSPSASV